MTRTKRTSRHNTHDETETSQHAQCCTLVRNEGDWEKERNAHRTGEKNKEPKFHSMYTSIITWPVFTKGDFSQLHHFRHMIGIQ